MDDVTDDGVQLDEHGGPPGAPDEKSKVQTTPADIAKAKQIAKMIRADRTYHKKAFDRMRRDMRVAMHGADKDWEDDQYTANITGRQIRQATDALYAKNPKIVARRSDKLDFAVWDETQQSLLGAMNTMQQAAQMTQPVVPHPVTGLAQPQEPQLPPEFAQAQATLQDFQQGMMRREQVKKIGKTLETLFAQAMRQQRPLDFKQGLKSVVRRTCTTGVGYVKVGFQRQMGPRQGREEALADAQQRLAHLQTLMQDAADGDISVDDPEVAELHEMIAALQAEPEQVLREGLVFDYPQSTKVIPDKLCKQLVGFVGARHITVEYSYTPQEVREVFGVDVKKNFSPYKQVGEGEGSQLALWGREDEDEGDDGLCCVWEHYDKPSGIVYYLCDGYDGYLRPPGPPDVFVADFWPVYALTFNAVESENEVFPPSDVTLMLNMQKEYNRSREGKRQHRKAARPRWVHFKGQIDDDDLTALSQASPFSNTAIKGDPATTKIQDILAVVPVPGVDPNLYDTNEIMTDVQFVVGSQRSQLGAPAKATATASSIAAGATQTSDSSAVDDLDNFLTCIARGSSQILMREMSEEIVVRDVGPGAFWPQQTLTEIFDDLWLEVQGGSTGKPNQALEIANWEKMLPFLIQMPGVSKDWLARETLRRLDDKADLTEALAQEMPSIVAQNRMAGAAPPPGGPPEDQGPQGANNGPPPPGGPVGSGAPMGDNHG